MQLPIQSTGVNRVTWVGMGVTRPGLLPQQLAFKRLPVGPLLPYKCVGKTCYCHGNADCDKLVLSGKCVDHICK